VKDHFLRLSHYNSWANRRVFESLSSQNGPKEPSALLSHICMAESVWLSRLEGTIPLQSIFGLLPFEDINQYVEKNEEGWDRLIHAYEDFGLAIFYKQLNGTDSKSLLSDILTHIFNHGTYHRAQIAILMRQNGLVPAVTDFIAFSRLSF